MEGGNEQRVQQFVRDSKNILKAYLNEYGLVIYSHKTTLRPNLVLFYGINPGYDPARHHRIRWKIRESLDYFADGFKVLEAEANTDRDKLPRPERLHEHLNLIDDQCWPYPSFTADYRMGRAPYQQHARNLLRTIGRPDALITNLLFGQAARTKDIPKNQPFDEACWKVHELILQIAKPNVIVTCATVVDKRLRRQLGLNLVPPARDSGYGPPHARWTCKQWEGTWRDEATMERRIVVCQIPQMAFFDITAEYSRNSGALEWAKAVVQRATEHP